MFKKFYGLIICLGRIVQPFLLLAIRLFWGYFFFIAGLGKLGNIESTAQFFQNLNIPVPHLNAYLVGLIEMIGGIMLVLGLGARLAAIPLAIVMGVAFALGHSEPIAKFLENPELITKEPPFNYLLAVLTIFAFGPGLFSLDAIGKWLWGAKCCKHDAEVREKEVENKS